MLSGRCKHYGLYNVSRKGYSRPPEQPNSMYCELGKIEGGNEALYMGRNMGLWTCLWHQELKAMNVQVIWAQNPN